MQTDVIIVGAGPTGLALAAQLIRYGIDFVIFDQKETTTPFSKAIGVQARTLEIYEQIGLSEGLISLGAIAEKARLIEGGKIRGELDLMNLGNNLSPYPYMLIVEQGKHEKLLYEFIKSKGKDVLWQTEIESLTNDETGVVANIKKADGQRDVITGKYMVGCDGAKSFVRHSAGLTFEGSTFERLFYVADVEIDWQFPHDAVQVCLAKSTITAFFPMVGGDNHYRIVGTFPEGHDKNENEILYEEIERQIKLDTELDLNIHDVKWFSVYKVHSRHVNKFSNGRCFVAGDAAHIHTPAGAQGMNTGIQDGYNLAWKLAVVLKDGMDVKVLETYNDERLANAKKLLKTTDRMFNLGANPDPIISYFRTHIFPHLAGLALSIDSVKHFVFPLISQIGISYHHSPLSENNGNFSAKAGDRMPYFMVEDTSIYDRLRDPKFHLLTFFDGQNKPAELTEDVKNKYGHLIDFHELTLYPNIAEKFGSNQTFSILLRPDNYIGLISSETSQNIWEDYLNSKFGLNL